MREAIRTRLAEAFARSELTVGQLSERTGLCKRTIRRVLAGDTFEPATIERIAASLRVVLA